MGVAPGGTGVIRRARNQSADRCGSQQRPRSAALSCPGAALSSGGQGGARLSNQRDLSSRRHPRSIREQINKAPPRLESFDLTEAIEGLPLVQGNRVQLRQVVLNLIVNAIEAMTNTGDDAREPVVSTESSPAEGLLVAVGA